MPFAFSDKDFDRIATVLGVPARREPAMVRYELLDEASGRRLSLEITPDLDLPGAVGEDQANNLISVYAIGSFLQLQGCTGFIASEELGEVLFFARRAGVAHGLVIEREAGCSLYSNVDERLLSADFTQLAPELVMSSVALSMTETLFDDLR